MIPDGAGNTKIPEPKPLSAEEKFLEWMNYKPAATRQIRMAEKSQMPISVQPDSSVVGSCGFIRQDSSPSQSRNKESNITNNKSSAANSIHPKSRVEHYEFPIEGDRNSYRVDAEKTSCATHLEQSQFPDADGSKINYLNTKLADSICVDSGLHYSKIIESEIKPETTPIKTKPVEVGVDVAHDTFLTWLKEKTATDLAAAKARAASKSQISTLGGNNISDPAVKQPASADNPSSEERGAKAVIAPPDHKKVTTPPIADACEAPSIHMAEPLTEAILTKIFGPAAGEKSDVFDDRVSDLYFSSHPKENIRGTQGQDAAEELLDWDKSWRPPPCDWEDRMKYDNSYINRYIYEDWQPAVYPGDAKFGLTDPAFVSGAAPVSFLTLAEPFAHEITIPEVEDDELIEKKRLFQTSESATQEFRTTKDNKLSTKQHWRKSQAMRRREIEEMEIGPHPFAPKIDIYLRPAVAKDISQITKIYNHYALNTILTEDQEAVTEDDMKYLLEYLKKEQLPFIVAVKVGMPIGVAEKRGRPGKGKATIPQDEAVVGFGFGQPYAYGIGNRRTGRSRLNLDIQFYVHEKFTRNGVGRSLLDRLLQCVSRSYGAKDGYAWMNPDKDDTYERGGVHAVHQVIVLLSTENKVLDQYYKGISEMLLNNTFYEDVTLKRFGRSDNKRAAPEFNDTVMFSKVVSLIGELSRFA
ncbi:hypothetical protein B0O99DRAFT_150344 [Bisporella sp. PMI_857]|nr:hypothetical protein B0O99DRAFT_150344 [Bisporella sp. PMI_857]